MLPSFSETLLPAAHLTPTTLLGGGGQEREQIGQLIASQIANLVLTRNPEERRTVVVGLGLDGGFVRSLSTGDDGRAGFFDLVESIGEVL
jgi:proteasome assembly chaperone 3